MFETITLSIGVGLLVSALFTELFGVGTGGMIVPGYIALYLDEPVLLFNTFLISFLTYAIVQIAGSFLILYGRRRTVMMILVSFMLGWLFRVLGPMLVLSGNFGLNIGDHYLKPLFELSGPVELTAIGYIIPGLIAIWMERQGTMITLCSVVSSSSMVRMVLILILGGRINL